MSEDSLPISDRRMFDGDLRNIFAAESESPIAQTAAEFIAEHRREIVGPNIVLDRGEQLRCATVHRLSS